MIQENHGSISNANGELIHKEEKSGVDIHLIKDDGTNIRDFPWGLDGREFCTGHQCWRGKTTWAITSVASIFGTSQVEKSEYRLIESPPTPHHEHRGTQSWGAIRNELTGNFANPHFNHFGTDNQKAERKKSTMGNLHDNE